MIGLSIFGSGRMGQIYASHVTTNSNAKLVSIVNPNLASAEKLTAQYGGVALSDPFVALNDDAVDAVIISTPTSTHLEYIEMAAKAGKAILCEKPLDLSLTRVDSCLEQLAVHPVPFMLGFNRRFDPNVSLLRAKVQQGEVGDLQILMLTSRDPAPPPLDYVKTSGGYFADSTIHDIDLACWIANERPVEVFATGSCLIDQSIGELGDVDTAMTVLKMPSGCLCHVNNSRRAVYGFDQRIEAFGSKGMLQTENQREDRIQRWGDKHTAAKAPLKHFFLERYEESFKRELDEFVDALVHKRPPSSTASEGRNTLAIALACERSRRERRVIQPDYV